MFARISTPVFVLMLMWTSVPFAGEKDKKSDEKTDKKTENDNPFRKAKVGDFNRYKMTTKVGDFAIEGTMKTIVTEKNEKTAKVKTEIMVMGASLPTQETTVDLTKPFDITGTVAQGQGGGKFEKSSEGTAKIKVGEKEYDANWIKGKLTGEAKGIKVDSEVKVWFSKAVPLDGMLRLETKASIADIIVELAEVGSTKKAAEKNEPQK